MSNQPQQLDLNTFLATSRPHIQKIGSSAIVDNNQVRMRLPQSGFGHRIWVTIQIALVIGGTVTGGTFKSDPDPAPFGILKKLQLSNNGALYARDISGWGLYKHLRTRWMYDILAPEIAANNFNTNSLLYIGSAGANLVRAGTTVTAGTWLINLSFPIELSYNNAGEWGMLNLQQNQTFWDLLFTFGQMTGGLTAVGGSNDLFNGLTGTSLTYTLTGTVSATIETFDALQNTDTLLDKFLSVTEMVNQTPTQGENTILVPQNDWYTMFITELRHNGAAMPVANFGDITMLHSGNVYDYIEDYGSHLVRNAYQHGGAIPMDGCVVHDLGLRRGVPGRRDTLDAINNQNITDLKIKYVLGSTALVNPLSRTVLECLRPINQ